MTDITPLEFATGKEVSVGLEKLRSSSGLTPAYQKAREAFFEEMVKERPDYDAAQLAVMERVSYLQARMKQKESQGAYSSEQNYTMANRTLVDTIMQLHKLDEDKLDLEKQKQEFMEIIADSVKFAIRDLDEDTQKKVMFLLSKRYEELNG